MRSLSDRIASAILHAMAAFVIAGLASCYALMFAVSDSHDGQAGMGAAVGGLLVGLIAAIVTLVISLRRSAAAQQQVD
jgi:membrane associated rhomboid family serine protease